MKANILFVLSILAIVTGCGNGNGKSDAYGNFEATEVIVSAEANGKLLNFEVDEGQTLKKGQNIGLIDSTQLWLKKQQVLAQKKAIRAKSANILSQVDVYDEQKRTLLVEKKRLEKLLKDGAATTKQMDDVNGKLKVIESQIKAVKTQNSTVFSELEVLDKQIAQINDQINKCLIINPINGTILNKYFEENELVIMGKALYKIADMSVMELRVYIDGAQLPHVKIGDKVEVLIDNSENDYRKLEGHISWISDKAEFTPKIIQTKKERVNLVYALKVKVKNDGTLKIAMPGEVNF